MAAADDDEVYKIIIMIGYRAAPCTTKELFFAERLLLRIKNDHVDLISRHQQVEKEIR